MNEIDRHWLLGLIEGEDTFGINIALRPEGGFVVSPSFKKHS